VVVLLLGALAAGTGAAGVAVADPTADARVTAKVRVERDITYRRVGGENLKLDAYIPAGGGRRPAVIALYGGGWVLGNRKFTAPMAAMLADQGFVTFAIDYRLAPKHPFPAAIDDVRAGIVWVREHASDFGVDPARIGAIGGSAGGHLAALAATLGEGPNDRGARVATAVSWAGPMDLHPARYGPDSHPYIEAFLDCVGRPCDEAKVVAASPISHVDASDPPMLLANGEEDQLVPPDQALRMADALERAGVPHELLLVPNAGHDERVIPPVERPSFDFLRQQLGGVEPSLQVGEPGGRGGDGNTLAPAIAVIIAVLVVGGVVVITRRRRRVALTKGS
jgi:acetyl esterase/lipase